MTTSPKVDDDADSVPIETRDPADILNSEPGAMAWRCDYTYANDYPPEIKRHCEAKSNELVTLRIDGGASARQVPLIGRECNRLSPTSRFESAGGPLLFVRACW